VALEQVFSEYFGFPCQSSFHQLLHNQPHLSSGACTIGQKWPQYPRDFVPPHKIKKNSDGCFIPRQTGRLTVGGNIHVTLTLERGQLRVSSVQESVKRRLERVKLKNLHSQKSLPGNGC
jgi:hypothetical protein